MNDDYQAALAEYGAAKAALEPWIGRSGPAKQLIEMERRLDEAAFRLAELAYEREGRR